MEDANGGLSVPKGSVSVIGRKSKIVGDYALEQIWGSGMFVGQFADPWYWVNRSIFPWYFSYKRKAL